MNQARIHISDSPCLYGGTEGIFPDETICKQKYQVYHFTSSESSNKWQILNLKIIKHKV